MARNTLSRSLHDLGLSAWSGGRRQRRRPNAAAGGPAATRPPAGWPTPAGTGGRRSTPARHRRAPAAAGSARPSGAGGPAAGRGRRCRLKTLLTGPAHGPPSYSRPADGSTAVGGPARATRHQAEPAHARAPADIAAATQQLDTLQWVIPRSPARRGRQLLRRRAAAPVLDGRGYPPRPREAARTRRHRPAQGAAESHSG